MQIAICTKFIDVHQNASPNLFYVNLIIVILRVDLVNGRSMGFFLVFSLNSVICRSVITTTTKLLRKEKKISASLPPVNKFTLEVQENASNY